MNNIDSPKITPELIEAYVECDRKAHFLFHGQGATIEHDYSVILKKHAALNTMRFHASLKNKANAATKKEVTVSNVVTNGDMIAEYSFTNKSSSAISTIMPKFEHEPYIVTGTYKVHKKQSILLAYGPYVAHIDTGKLFPARGFIVTMNGKRHWIDLTAIYPEITSVITNLRRITKAARENVPKLILNAHCPVCPFRTQCYKEAVESDNLSLLGRMTPKLMARYEKKGICTIKQLSFVFNPRKRRKKSNTTKSIFSFELQALALRTEKIYLHQKPDIASTKIELFLDIEGIPDQEFYYLIGLNVVYNGELKVYSFWANSKENEQHIFLQLLYVVSQYKDAPIYHYGNYEAKAISHVARKYNLESIERIVERFVNVNTFVYGKVYFPVRSNRLKDLGAEVGAVWDSPDASGLQSLVWRHHWEERQDEQLKMQLLRYNLDDCMALRLLVNELRNIGETAISRTDIEFSVKPKKISTEKGIVIHSQLTKIIVSAHEDTYMSRRIKKESDTDNSIDFRIGNVKIQREHPIVARKISKNGGISVTVPRKRLCYQKCGGALVVANEVAEHSLIELLFTKSGCKKTVIRYQGKIARCPICGALHCPPAINRIRTSIFGHQLQSWAVHQRVVLRMPFNAISTQFSDLFNEHLSEATIVNFVKNFSKKYTKTQDLLLKCILQSPVIHVDETTLNIKGETQYAWAITDGKHVIFWLTKTREATKLQEILKDYKGVLVSDFYSGYDAFSCKQQKCLVHLIRDINDDLWKNPFDKQYEDFVGEFKNLVIPIFDSVDRHGLKERNLRKHLKSVHMFYEKNINVKATCELIEKYQKRFIRYRNSLFTFAEGDGIPWNNNMAERAIRHLAVQRKISGWFAKAGAERYLVMLGIAQSCRFQKKSFLRFLISGKMDLDEFNEKRDRPRNLG